MNTIKTWQERMKEGWKPEIIEGLGDSFYRSARAVNFMKAEIADLRAALAAKEQREVVGYLIDDPDDPEIWHWFDESPSPAFRSRALGFIDTPPAAPVADDALGKTIQERDHYHDTADKLAEAIAKYFGADIGEHSSANCPWDEALRVIEEAAPVADGGDAVDAKRYRWILENYALGDGYRAVDNALIEGEADTTLSPAIDAAIAASGVKP